MASTHSLYSLAVFGVEFTVKCLLVWGSRFGIDLASVLVHRLLPADLGDRIRGSAVRLSRTLTSEPEKIVTTSPFSLYNSSAIVPTP